MSLFFKRYSDESSTIRHQQLKGAFVNGRYQKNVSSSSSSSLNASKAHPQATQKVKKVVLDAPTKPTEKTVFFTPPKHNSKLSTLVGRTEIKRRPPAPVISPLSLTTQCSAFLTTFSLSWRALKAFSSTLERATSDHEVVSAVTTLKENSPQAAEFLTQWLVDTIHEIPSQSAKEVYSFLRSESGKILFGGLLRAFKELQPKVNTLKLYLDLYRAFERYSGRPEQFKSRFWDTLPKEVQSSLSRQVFEISQPKHPVDHFGRTEIEKNPSILYSLKGRNILQEQIQQLEQQFDPTFTRHLEESRHKCLAKLLKVDTTAYQDQRRFIRREINQLKSLQAILKNYSIERRNEALSHFFKLDVQTTGALLHAIWIADDSPTFIKNRDLELGLHLFESNPMLLINIREDHVDSSLIDWAIKFYENQLRNFETISILEGLERTFEDPVSIHTLLWAFNSCDKMLIQDPLLEQMSSQGLTEAIFRTQPVILVTPPSFDELSPLAEVIAQKKKECELSITKPVKQAQKIFDSTDSVPLSSVSARLHIGFGLS